MADFSLEAYRPELQQYLRESQSRPLNPPAGPQESLGVQPPKEVSFRDSIRTFVHDVDNMQKDASDKVQLFMAGEIADVHDVMVAVEKANTSFQLLMELRNKMLDAYREIKSMSM